MGCNSDSCPIGTGFAPAAASAASGAVAPSGCPCDKGSKRKTPTMGGGIASPPSSEWQSPSFVPQPPPPRKSDVARPSVPTPPAMQQEPPAQKGGSFVPVLTPRVQKQANGKAPIPPRIIDVPADQPVALKTPQESAAPVPFLPTTPMIGLAADPNPFAPYCGNGIDAASELCRAASDAGLSDYCRQQLLAFLGSKSEQTLGSWIAAQELCDQAALRRAVGIAEASIAAKTSSGLYDKPGFGNPFGVDGYAWKQDRVRKPSPFAYQGDGATMDYRAPSGGMPNYHRPSGGTPTLAEWTAQGNDPEQWQAAFGGEHTGSNAFTASNIQAFNESQAGQSLYRQELAQAAAAAPPATPPVDYAAVIGSVGQAVGGVFAGVNTAVNNAAQNRLRELEIEYANNARGAQLALQRSTLEMQAEIARLSAQSTPAAQATVTALQQQVADANARLNAAAAADQGMSPVAVGALVVGGVAVLGTVAYVLMGKRR